MRSAYLVGVSDLLSGRESSRRTVFSAPLELSLDEAEIESEAAISVDLERVADRLRATGSVQVPVHLTCVRCLTRWEEKLTAPLFAHFAPLPEDDEYPIATDETIDLEAPVRDDVSESIPLLPLCRPDCAGLCPICGTDLNTGRCPGHEVEDDSPFASLRQLISD